MAMTTIEKKELYRQFQEAFPIEYLKEMPLEKYTNLKNKDGDDSFCYWVETKTRYLGSIKGGYSSKFGIYKYIEGNRPEDKIVQSDDTYAWYRKYDKATAQEAYTIVRDAVVRIAELASKGEFEEIEKIDVFGDGYKWKIAFLYSDETIIPIYNRDWLNIIAEDLGMDNPKAKSFFEIQQFLMSQRNGRDIYQYHDELLEIKDKHVPAFSYKELKSEVKKRLEEDDILKAYNPGQAFLWIGTSDGHLHSDDCHYELCWDKTKKAGHDGNTVFVEMHCEMPKTAKLFEPLKDIDGISEFKWGAKCLGIRINNQGWKATDYSVEELAKILVDELYKLHQLVGNQAIGIEMQISQSAGVPSPSTKGNKYEYYRKLLKGTKNLVLTGAPGTGKTFMAQAIADEMDAVPRFVQFHPSYDYTDFVEGLRPIDKGNGRIEFERKDGVFKEFCREAIENLIDSEKSVESLSKEMTWQEQLNQFVDDAIDSGEKFKTVNGSEFTISEMKRHTIIVHNEQNEKTTEVSVNADEILELLTNEVPLKIVRDIRNHFNRKFGTQPDSYAFVITNAVRAMKKTVPVVTVNKVARKDFVFIIDEINRGEASKIFGELFYAIDPGYRGKKKPGVQTQYQNLVPETDVFAGGFYVPENVYILATMNDIDRSVESMDFAMRRRFTWKEITPTDTESMLNDLSCADKAKETMHRLNKAIAETEGLGSAYMIGPAYFLKLEDNGGNFNDLWIMNIEPLLKEYLRGFRKADEILKKFHKAYFDEKSEPEVGSPLLENEN